MNESKRTFLASLGACLAAAAVSPQDRAADAAKDEPLIKNKREKTPGFDQAILANQLAMEAHARKSPILMLAAIELLANLKESDRSSKAVKTKTQGTAGKSDKKSPTLQLGDWVDAARAYAKDDKELTAFLEKRLEKLSSRGIIYAQGVGKSEVTVRGVTFKVIKSGVLFGGQILTLSNVRFNGNQPAVLAVVSDGEGYTGLGVIDERTNTVIGKDTDGGKVNLVRWYPTEERPVTIRIPNVGSRATSYMVLANW